MSSSVAEPGRENPSETYETIEKAVMETERGRWFLAEHARRQRSAETAGIFEALKRLEAALVPSASSRPPDDALDYMQSAARELMARSDALRRIAGELENQDTQAALASEADAVRLVALNHDLFRHRFAGIGRPVAPTADQLKYFAADEEEFEDAAPQQTPASPLRAVPPVQLVTEAPPAKNRIVIIRHAAGEEPVIPLQNELAAAG